MSTKNNLRTPNEFTVHRDATKLLAMNYRAAQTPEEVACAYQALIAHFDALCVALSDLRVTQRSDSDTLTLSKPSNEKGQ